MYPITYEADYARERNRLTVFFRALLSIPWWIVGLIYVIAAYFVTIVAWFALVILGRYPDWAYNFNSGFLRFNTRLNAWFYLQVDQWPPFGFAPDPTYPARVEIAPRAEKQSRLKVFFRWILAFPLVFVWQAGIIVLHQGAAVVAWLTIVFRGYQPAGVHNALAFAIAFQTRLVAYALLLMRDEYPPVGDEPTQVGDVRTPAPAAPPPEPPASARPAG